MTDDSRTPLRRTPRRQPHRILVLALGGVSAIDLGVPVQVFGRGSNAVSPTASVHPSGILPGGTWPYSVDICGAAPGVVTGADGLSYCVDVGLDALESADTIVIPGATSVVDDEPSAAVVGALLSAS